MAITIDVTPAGINANSYNTLAEADTYFEADLEFDALWSALTNDQKKARLVTSTRGIDRYPFVSRKFRDFSFDQNEQALEFPRLSDLRVDLIHPRVKKAQLEMIKYQYHNTDTITGESELNQEVIKVNVHQVVSVGMKDHVSGEAKDSKQLIGSSIEAVEALLRPWLRDGIRDSGPFDFTR